MKLADQTESGTRVAASRNVDRDEPGDSIIWIYRLLMLLSLAPIMSSCALLAPVAGDDPTRVFVVETDSATDATMALLRRQAPAIKSESDWAGWNRPGVFELSRDHDDELVLRIDPTRPTLYAELREFVAASGKGYRNLLYRFHFERVPHQFKPFHITAGRNGGVFVIVTINENDKPLLLTTVHSCGCYLAFIPTNRLTLKQLPEGWSLDEQVVFEESLPGVLNLPNETSSNGRLTLLLRDGTHRVANVSYEKTDQPDSTLDTLVRETMTLRPLSELDNLPVAEGGKASAFDDKGYLRGAGKPLELMLMSWWTLDRRIGVDKRLEQDAEQGSSFYTSIKPWHRSASDMRNFGDFLAYWGFRL